MKFLIVDDHPLIREGLSHVLLELDQNCVVVEAESADAAIAAALEHHDLSLILLDLSLPGADRLTLLKALRERREDVPVVVLSATDDPATIRDAIDIGAMGFISKRSATKIIVNALRLVLVGGVYVPPQSLRAIEPPEPPHGADGAELDAASSAAVFKRIGITPRQTEVLALLVQGKPTKVICRELGLAEGTVKTHIASILHALNVANRTQAMFMLSRIGVKLPGLIAHAAQSTPAGG
jgi:DNA-binding NarL/FixJ family response regulator